MLMKEAEKGIRYLCGMWAKEVGMSTPSGNPPMSFEPNFSDFYSWVQSKHSTYLNFKSHSNVRYMVEMWFDNEFKQK
jgi:hypothetical protein